jgi:gluconate 5-dehydrogenase
MYDPIKKMWRKNMTVEELFNLKKRVAIVTGPTTGLGKQFAAALAECGATLVLASRRLERCKEMSKEFKETYGIEALAVKLDVTEENDVKQLVKDVVDEFGRIDILVNNAGLVDVEESHELPIKKWDEVVNTNLRGLFLCCREVGNQMITQKYGKIVNIASVYSYRARDWRNYAVPEKINTTFSYSASKGGVAMLTRDLAVDWAKHGITVNAISPGAFMTEMTREFCEQYTIDKLTYRIPMGRWGGDDDLKGAIVFLTSDASKYLTGQNVVVDGGWSTWC